MESGGVFQKRDNVTIKMQSNSGEFDRNSNDFGSGRRPAILTTEANRSDWVNSNKGHPVAAILGSTSRRSCCSLLGMAHLDWNEAYLLQNTPWDQGTAAPPLQEFLHAQPITGRVLLPGCGRGHDVRLLAATERVDAVVGMDLAPAAIYAARAAARCAKESYQIADFLQLSPDQWAQYDWVVEHTCLCALDPAERPAYVAAVAQALRPGGNFLAIFYREVLDYDGTGPPHPISAQEIEALFGHCFERVQGFVPQQTYPNRPIGAEEVVWMRRRD